MQSKAEQALALLEQPADTPRKETFSMSIRLPGETADRFLALYDLGLSDFPPNPVDIEQPRKPQYSRNQLVIALIEAGLEAVEAVSKNKPKGKKNA